MFVNVVMRNNATLFYEKKMKHLVGLFGGLAFFSVVFVRTKQSGLFRKNRLEKKVFFTVRPVRKDLSWSKVKRLNYICCREHASLRGEAEFN